MIHTKILHGKLKIGNPNPTNNRKITDVEESAVPAPIVAPVV